MLKYWKNREKKIKKSEDNIKQYTGMGGDYRWWEAQHEAQQNLSSASKDMYR